MSIGAWPDFDFFGVGAGGNFNMTPTIPDAQRTGNVLFECEIPGRPIIKKNTQRIIRRGGKTFAIYSPRFKAWLEDALFHLKQSKTRRSSIYTGECMAEYVFYFKNRQGEADVSNLIEGVQDALATAEIIENDKQIVQLSARKIFDGTEKTVIRLYAI
jgi:Holliday junction resolvase RusA-like endonuclease